jgi:hypothetical protein
MQRREGKALPGGKKNAGTRPAFSVEAGFIQARNLSSSALSIVPAPPMAKLKV